MNSLPYSRHLFHEKGDFCRQFLLYTEWKDEMYRSLGRYSNVVLTESPLKMRGELV
jgi:hypothetical protein